ncbi:MAG TPA: helix-turn-helix domain-containing protein [Candidatus Binatia bacterium]|jgi:transcriptional regulator with XRE-family HTH domain|nr:helix-turn-helix domain-containing protein [Candidatus Binatia bacterium]
MTPQAVRELREHLQLTQEVFASILGVSFATVNRWENGKTTPTGDYARVLQTLERLTAYEAPGPAIDWRRVGALSAMASVAGFSPLLTLGAALAPVLVAYLPSWSDVPGGERSSGNLRTRPQDKNTKGSARTLQKSSSSFTTGKVRAKAETLHTHVLKPSRASARRTGW